MSIAGSTLSLHESSFIREPIHPDAGRFYEREARVDVRGWSRTWPSVTDRLWRRLDMSAGIDGCWPWMGAVTAQGYGQISGGTHGNLLVHRTVYEIIVGPIPEGHHLDHLCHSRSTNCCAGAQCPHRRCANPFDLEPVSPAENIRRAGLLVVECAKGHPYTPENTEFNGSGHRRCRECHRLGMRERYQPKPRKATPDVLARIGVLRREGLSTAAIGREVGLSQPYISRLLQRIESEGSRS